MNVLLHELPIEHPLRTRPMREIGVEIRNRQTSAWRNIATWKLGRVSYDQMGDQWKKLNEFRAPLLTESEGVLGSPPLT